MQDEINAFHPYPRGQSKTAETCPTRVEEEPLRPPLYHANAPAPLETRRDRTPSNLPRGVVQLSTGVSFLPPQPVFLHLRGCRLTLLPMQQNWTSYVPLS